MPSQRATVQSELLERGGGVECLFLAGMAQCTTPEGSTVNDERYKELLSVY
jgi:hypothetical protein